MWHNAEKKTPLLFKPSCDLGTTGRRQLSHAFWVERFWFNGHFDFQTNRGRGKYTVHLTCQLVKSYEGKQTNSRHNQRSRNWELQQINHNIKQSAGNWVQTSSNKLFLEQKKKTRFGKQFLSESHIHFHSQPLNGVFHFLRDEVSTFQGVGDIVETPLGDVENPAGIVQVQHPLGGSLHKIGKIPRQTNKRGVQVWPCTWTGLPGYGTGGGSWEQWRNNRVTTRRRFLRFLFPKVTLQIHIIFASSYGLT